MSKPPPPLHAHHLQPVLPSPGQHTLTPTPLAAAALDEQMYPGETITIDLEPSVEEVLEMGLARLESKTTWKLWKSEDREFLDADSFRYRCRLLGGVRERAMQLCLLVTGKGRVQVTPHLPPPYPCTANRTVVSAQATPSGLLQWWKFCNPLYLLFFGDFDTSC